MGHPDFQSWRAVSGRAARVALSLLAAVVCCLWERRIPQARFEQAGGKLMCTCGCAALLWVRSCGLSESRRRDGHAAKRDCERPERQPDPAGFVQRYGQLVLSAPTTEGFDLLAWIMPFAVAAAALIGTILLVRHWAKNQPKLLLRRSERRQRKHARTDSPRRDG
jgi:hypothetical protein